MFKTLTFSLTVALCLLVSEAFAFRTGDKATELNIKTWLLNGPVPLIFQKNTDADEKKMFVLEFWGSWAPACRDAIPILVYLQKKYAANGLKIIAISREDENTIKKFMAEYPEINYAMAMDDKSSSTLKYLGQSMILPKIFIINSDQDIIWDGEVADLPGTLENIYAGKHDLSRQTKVSKLQEEMQLALQSGREQDMITLSDKILDLDPENGPAVRMRMFMFESSNRQEEVWKFLNALIAKHPDIVKLYFIKLDFASRYQQYSSEAGKLAETFLKQFPANTEDLNNVAWTLLTRFPMQLGITGPAYSCVDQALKNLEKGAADNVLKATCLNSLSLLNYRCGNPENALKIQKQVITLLKGLPAEANAKRLEEFYLDCIKTGKLLKKQPLPAQPIVSKI
ncbi:MAG: TlpA disulfide reductase family protein [Victivallaceae bacterium]